MEYAVYVLIYICAVYFSIFPYVIKEKYFFILWITITMMLSYALRIKYDPSIVSDISIYGSLMRVDVIPNVFYREFIFFFGMKYLYNFIGNEIYVFITFDLITFILLYKGLLLIKKGMFEKIHNQNIFYMYFGILLFFPFVMGIHTLLRQLMAVVLFFNAFGLICNKKYFLGLLIFLIAFFVHNSTIYFLPAILFIIEKPGMKTYSVIFLISILIVNSMLPSSTNELFYRDYRTNTEGYKITLAYIYSLLSIFILLTIIEVTNGRGRKMYLVWTTLMLILIYFSSLDAFSSGISQRVAFLVYSYLFPIIVYYIELNFKQKIIMRIVYLNVSILPIIIIHNSTIDITPLF